MDQMEANFFIPFENKEAALQAIKNLEGGETITYGSGKPHFSWVDTEDFVNADTLKDALREWRWSVEEDGEGNIYDIYFEGEKLGDDNILFEAIAPYVKSGSFIQMCGEDGTIWRWVFENSKCEEKYAELVF